MALALQGYEDGLCAGCGQPLHESMDKANHDAYDVRTLRCHGCTAIDAKSESYKSGRSGEVRNIGGVRFVAALRK